eukprot:3511176-Rhodomonas_salina.2
MRMGQCWAAELGREARKLAGGQPERAGKCLLPSFDWLIGVARQQTQTGNECCDTTDRQQTGNDDTTDRARRVEWRAG